MLIATCTLAGALAVLWLIVRMADALVRLALRQRGGRSLLVQLWAFVLLPGALLRLLVRLLVAWVLRVRVTEARLHLPRALDARGTLHIDTMEIAPTDVLRESLIETIPAIAASICTLIAALFAGYALRPGDSAEFVTNLLPIIGEAFRRDPGRAAMGTYAMIALSTAMALPGPLGRRTWLVSLIAPAFVWLAFVALEAWPLRLLPFVDSLTGWVHMATQAVGLAAAFNLLLLTLVMIGVWLRRTRRTRQTHRADTATATAHAADTVTMATRPLPTQTLPNGDLVPAPPQTPTRPFRGL